MWSAKKKISFVMYEILGSWLPESRHCQFAKFVRNFWAKKVLLKMGTNTNIEKKAYFGPDISLGNNSGLGVNSKLYGKVSIGNNVLMGPDVIIYTSGHRYDDISIPITEQGFTEEKEVIIHDNVWIGCRVVILPGVEVGEGAVIGAGAVVTNNVEPFSVVGGVPAKVIKRRK